MKTPFIYKSLAAVGLLVACASVSNAFAGREKAGNGGNAAVCFNSSREVEKVKKNGDQIANDQLDRIVSIKALDLYQAEAHFKGQSSKKNLILPEPSEDGMAYVDRILKRFEHILPNLQRAFLEQAQSFNPKKYSYYTKGGIDRIYDTAEQYYLDPSKCVVATLIRRTTAGDEATLEFDWRLFNHPAHKQESRGVLMLHEVVYKWATDRANQTDSSGTRRFIANILLRRDVVRSEVISELEATGMGRVAFDKGATAEFQALGSLQDTADLGEQMTSSDEFRKQLRKIEDSSGIDLNVFGYQDFQEVRDGLVNFRTVDEIFAKLPTPQAKEAQDRDRVLRSIESMVSECQSPRNRDERRKCREYGDLPSLKSILTQAKVTALRAHAAATAEVASNRVKAEEIRVVVSKVFEDEFNRISAIVVTGIETYLTRLDHVGPWFNRDVAQGLRDYAACLLPYFRVDTQRVASDAGATRKCGTEDGYFEKVWDLDPPVPVIERLSQSVDESDPTRPVYDGAPQGNSSSRKPPQGKNPLFQH